MNKQFYSQNGEDKFVAELGISIRTVLDIGANDGLTFSNSRYFIENGATYSLLIEPDPRAIVKLVDLYKQLGQVDILQCLFSCESGAFDLLLLAEDSLVSTSSSQERERWEKKSPTVGRLYLNAIGWQSLQHFLRTQVVGMDIWDMGFDLISIDAEGASWEILNQMPWRFFSKARVIIVEFDYEENPDSQSPTDKFRTRSPQQYVEAFQRLSRSNVENVSFELAHTTSENLIFVRKENQQ